MRVFLVIILTATVTETPALHRLETIDAKVVEGTLAEVTDTDVVMSVKNKVTKLARADVMQIALADASDAMATPGQAVVVTAGGDRLAAGKITLAAGTLTVVTSALKSLKLPLSRVSAIYLPDKQSTAAEVRQKCEELRLTASRRDILVATKKGGAYLGIEGVAKAIGDKTVTFNWQGKDRTSERKVVRAILIATAATQPAAAAGTLALRDGSTLSFTGLAFDGKKITAETAVAGKVAVAADAVASVWFRSDRVTNLAEIKPVAVKQYGFFDSGFGYRTNRSVGGGPLRLGGKTYARGLGLHSFAELTYDLNGQYGRFVVTVGIDDAVRPRGDATLVFLGDGKELGKPIRLTGKDEPVAVRLDLKAVKRLTIRVDFGEDKFDVADHVDLVSARLVK